MKKSICRLCRLLIVLIASFTAIGQTISQSFNTEPRVKINFNREWKFILKDSDSAQNMSFDDSSWEQVNLPHSFSIPYFMWKNVYTGYGWYRKQFDAPTSWNGKTVTIEFEGSFIETELYVNGSYIGKHVGGYTGFNFDITSYLVTGTNIIAVRVNNLWNARVAPRTGDHQFSGGIYRDVYLNITDKLHVDWYGTFITTPVVSKTSAICKVKTEVRNNYPVAKKCTVKTSIVDPKGNIISIIESTDHVPANSVKIFEQTLPEISNPKLWSPGTPNLHKAITTVLQKGNVVDNYETTFGIRWFKWTSDQGFFLNGEHFYLLGANVHQDHAGWGDAVTNAAMKRDVKMMKDAGFNCIRGSHYPHDPSFTQACDELGMIFFSENAFWGMGGGSGDRNGWVVPPSSCYPPNTADQPYFNQSVLNQLKEAIKIHRNRASIAAWSMCNEPFFTDNSTLTPMKNLLNVATDSSRKWDPSRDVAIGGAQRQGVDKLGKGAIAFYNGDGASLYPNPGVPNMVSEYGSTVANRPGKFIPGWGDVKNGWNRPSWRSGQVIWCGFDHGTIGGEALATMGLVDYFRLPKRQYYWYQEAYAKGNTIPVEPIWPVPGTPAKLKLESSNSIITATDGTDDVQLIVTVLDAN
jgi:beta-galactosidase/beta-glucuronidase